MEQIVQFEAYTYLWMPIIVFLQDTMCKQKISRWVIRFFKGLNESFNVVKSYTLLIEPLPPLNKVFALVLQHECSLNVNVFV